MESLNSKKQHYSITYNFTIGSDGETLFVLPIRYS